MKKKKLHLGCGTLYLEGYTNIDHPPSEHTVQKNLIADEYKNILDLKYENSTIDEVRLHHVFEHFSRQIALVLLCRWADWLKPGAKIHIETPDVMRSALALISPLSTKNSKSQIIRHLFGSHEASWAVHWDGWYSERFKRTLKSLGFEKIKIKHTRWGALRNIEVTAIRSIKTFSNDEYESIVRNLLKKSLVTHFSRKSFWDIASSELEMLEVWMEEWKKEYMSNRLSVD